ncbi:hypothetical protein VITFI_CDS0243 [Vitreoscilla filiformis]|uniref:Uncharacterized protein n=1 Tax=Vitreoscilla filiformis TaxID=63 RepID=A0A221KAI3_VITFI|nr:hypothetical protein VITFI_CDS0243 [Vitreoscilla filiformis]
MVQRLGWMWRLCIDSPRSYLLHKSGLVSVVALWKKAQGYI